MVRIHRGSKPIQPFAAESSRPGLGAVQNRTAIATGGSESGRRFASNPNTALNQVTPPHDICADMRTCRDNRGSIPLQVRTAIVLAVWAGCCCDGM